MTFGSQKKKLLEVIVVINYFPNFHKFLALKMVKISLQINANLDQVEELYTNHPNYAFLLKIKCLNCGECPDVWHDVVESITFPSKSGKSDSHYSAKCKLCGRENSLSIIEGSNG